jgi:hypothetical protein
MTLQWGREHSSHDRRHTAMWCGPKKGKGETNTFG